jgi:hypothetical protein
MSERMTHIGAREVGDRPKVQGIEAYGRLTRAEMIRRFRDYHERQLRDAQAALALNDDELIVTTYRGTYAQRGKREVTE